MVSIIIVHYNVKKELFDCINSILASKTKTKYEIIVVDNDEKPKIEKELRKKFSQVIYTQGHGNVGFGQGNNIGARIAKGEFFFFLNPDTKIFPDCLEKLITFLQKAKKAGIVAPLLHDIHGKSYQQGSLDLTPFQALGSMSFLHKLFPNNPIAKKYYLSSWDQQTIKEVAVAPGTAFLIRKSLFEKLGGFDKHFFLYFEEFDLCRRARQLHKKIYILPTAKLLHHWGASTKKVTNINRIFAQSRFYYFKKHFGIISAILTEAFLRIDKYAVFLAFFIAFGTYFRLATISQSMTFLGDQGWFFLAARDMFFTGEIPLVGIPSSHPWLHQGALWTYLLAGWFPLFHFNPISAAYLTTLTDMLAIVLLYKLGSLYFSKFTGIVAASFYTISPLVLSYTRTPYHTSVISFFTILFLYLLYFWLKGKSKAFPLLIFILGILYNLELATFLLTVILLFILMLGFWKKKLWFKQLLNKQIKFFSFLAFVLSMLPMLLYDFSHHFVQTLGFSAWVVYKGLISFGFPSLQYSTAISFGDMTSFLETQSRGLISPYSLPIVVMLFVIGSIYVIRDASKQLLGAILLLFINTILLAGFVLTRTPSEAYLPMFFPSLFLLIAWGIVCLIHSIHLKPLGIILYIIILFSNIHFLLNHNYSFRSDFDSYAKRLAAAKYIVKEAGGKEYNLRGAGLGSEFASFTMNYEYLTWWLGHGQSHVRQPLIFIIEEKQQGVTVKKIYD